MEQHMTDMIGNLLPVMDIQMELLQVHIVLAAGMFLAAQLAVIIGQIVSICGELVVPQYIREFRKQKRYNIAVSGFLLVIATANLIVVYMGVCWGC